jgi:hypothetical protein
MNTTGAGTVYPNKNMALRANGSKEINTGVIWS